MVKFILEIYNNWDTEKGLLLFFIVWSCFSLFILPQSIKFLNGIFPSDYYLNELGKNYILFLYVYVIFLIILYGAWKYKRSFGFLTNNINVIFAINNASDSKTVDKTLINLKNRIEEEISTIGFKNKILLDFKPRDLLIKSKEEAEEIVQAGYVGSTLIIWGKAYEFSKEVKCPRLNFTYFFAYKKYYKNLPDEFYKESVNKPIKNSIDVLKWNLPLNFSYAFEEYVINVTEIVFFILGKILTTIKKYKESLEILSKLYDSFKSLNSIEQKKRGRLIIETKEEIIRLYRFFSFEKYLEDNYFEMEKYCSRILALDQYNYDANLSKAIYEEEIGHREDAKKYISVAEANAPKNTNAHKFSLAYFALDEGNFGEAVEYYDFLREHNADFNPVKVADYLHRKYEKTKKIEFLFAEGLIKIQWLSKPNDGKDIMQLFLKEALKNETPEKYSILLNKGQKIIVDDK